jgi:hypothetical protein
LVWAAWWLGGELAEAVAKVGVAAAACVLVVLVEDPAQPATPSARADTITAGAVLKADIGPDNVGRGWGLRERRGAILDQRRGEDSSSDHRDAARGERANRQHTLPELHKVDCRP